MEGQFEINREESKKRLDVVFATRFNEFTRAYVKKLITEAHIIVNGEKVKAGYIVKFGDVVSFNFSVAQEPSIEGEDIDFEIVYEDGDLLVINKPQGLVVHPCNSTKRGTLVNGLLNRVKDLSGINGVLRPGIVHRLDKNTSGLMLVAKNDFAHNSLAKQIKEKTCERRYLALVEGHFKDSEGRIETYLERSKSDRKKMTVSEKGKLAISNYKVVSVFSSNDLVEFYLKTGRTHQIRVHCKYLGHSIVGDDVYGNSVKGLNGQLLHSYYIEFNQPRTNERMKFTVDLPKYFSDYMNSLKKL